MKTKLLKRVRRRFEILHNPTGVWLFGEKIEFTFLVRDKENPHSYDCFNDVNHCKYWILRKVRKEYKKEKQNAGKNDRNIKVWFK